MTKNTTDIRNKNAKHSYEVQTDKRGGYVNVDANTRGEAARLAKAAGHTVLSVNMVG